MGKVEKGLQFIKSHFKKEDVQLNGEKNDLQEQQQPWYESITDDADQADILLSISQVVTWPFNKE